MRKSLQFRFAVMAFLFATTSAQQTPKFPDTEASNLPEPDRVKLFNDQPGLVEPVLIPLPPLGPSVKCKGVKDSGAVTLSFVIDSSGNPRNVRFKRANANQIDLIALNILPESQFHPATINGTPVAFGRDVEVHLRVCTEQQPGSTSERTRLLLIQEEKFISWRHAPAEVNLAPIHMPPDAQADREKIGNDFTLPTTIATRVPDVGGMSGYFEFGVLVDEHGISHIEKVLKSTNQALLPVAEAALLNLRSTPAMKDGMPVSVHITSELDINSR